MIRAALCVALAVVVMVATVAVGALCAAWFKMGGRDSIEFGAAVFVLGCLAAFGSGWFAWEARDAK